MVDLEVRPQRFGFAADELVERVLAPVGVAAFGRLALHALLAGRRVLLVVAQVLHHVRRRLHPHVTGVVEALPSRTSGDLGELAIRQDPHARPVVLAQLGEQHRADRHVDADAERVGATDDLEQPVLGELLDEQPVLRQQAGVVDADAGGDEAPQVLADRRVEAEPVERLANGVLLGPAERIEGEVVLRRFGGLLLREVDEVDRRLAARQQLLDAVVQRRGAVLEVQRDGSLDRRDEGRVAAGPRGEVAAEELDVAERRRHEQELGVRQFEQRHLPGPAPLRVAVVVELVDDGDVDGCLGSVARGPSWRGSRRCSR